MEWASAETIGSSLGEILADLGLQRIIVEFDQAFDRAAQFSEFEALQPVPSEHMSSEPKDKWPTKTDQPFSD